jgi:hypothetical protein
LRSRKIACFSRFGFNQPKKILTATMIVQIGARTKIAAFNQDQIVDFELSAFAILAPDHWVIL